MTAGRSWWERNRLWVYLLVPLLLVAVAASGFRFVRIYLPWNWTRPHVAQGSTMTFSQEFTAGRARLARTVTLTALGARIVPEHQGLRAMPGGALHRVEVEFAAAPDVPLTGCDLLLLGPDGTRYSASAGQEEVPGARAPLRTLSFGCVPADTPGPTLDEDGLVPAETTRPPTWRVVTAFALPEGVRPTAVRVQWDEPDYAVVTLPG